jgi:hypothetical protein
MFKVERESGVTYKGFSWHSEVTDHVKKAQLLFAEQRHARQTAVVWEQCQMLPDGQFLTWKKAAAYQAGYTWFYRALVKLSKSDKEACSWFVVGHPNDYDPELVAAARLQAAAGEVTTRVEDRLAQPLNSPIRTSAENITAAEAVVIQGARMPQYAGQVLCPEATAHTDAEGNHDSQAVALYRDPCVALSIIRRQRLLADNSSRYEMHEVLGEGSFGSIFRATRGPFDVAVKQMRSLGWSSALDEAYVVERCREHPHIIQLLDAFSTETGGKVKAHLVYELWGTDLGAHVALSGMLPPQDIRAAIAQVCSALDFLHRQVEMIHTDVKSTNVLVTRRTEATGRPLICKLADFGSCVEALWDQSAKHFRILELVWHKHSKNMSKQTMKTRATEADQCTLFAYRPDSMALAFYSLSK